MREVNHSDVDRIRPVANGGSHLPEGGRGGMGPYGPNTQPSLTRYTGRIEARYDRLMTTDVYPLQVLLVTLAGWINRHQQHVIEVRAFPEGSRYHPRSVAGGP
jgi:hypothetical protein